MTTFPGKTALIVEDDETSIRVLEQLLKQVDVATDVIHDSYTIKDRLQEVEAPDVIFLDLEMPQSNGYTVLQLIQNNPKFDNIPVVAYTTHISHLNGARRAGFHSFLGKPLDGRMFASQLERIFGGEAVWEV